MKIIRTINTLIVLALLAYACGSTEAASDKLAELDSLKEQLKSIKGRIAELENDLRESGQLAALNNNKILVSTIQIEPRSFKHKIEVRGYVASRKNIMITAETMGSIKSIKISEGQYVKEGQLLMKLDDEILGNNINEIKIQLALAKTVFERQTNLWEQNIGTEIQYLQAKSNKESLDGRLSTLESQIRKASIYAPFDGVIDNISVREGELAQPGMPLVRMVNPESMHILSDISEAFLGKFEKGDKVEVYFPSQDKSLISEVASVGQVINNENRTFELEVKLPTVNFTVKPNQVTVLNLVDYSTDKAFVLPTKLVQKDSKGTFVYKLIEEENSILAKKVHIVPGISFNQETEILSGLSDGQIIADRGYRELAENVKVTIANN